MRVHVCADGGGMFIGYASAGMGLVKFLNNTALGMTLRCCVLTAPRCGRLCVP